MHYYSISDVMLWDVVGPWGLSKFRIIRNVEITGNKGMLRKKNNIKELNYLENDKKRHILILGF